MIQEKENPFKKDMEFYRGIGIKIKEARHTNINQFTGKCFLITQTKVAKALGTTFQQIQKYEKAHNRIPLISLIKIGNYLKKPLSYFGVESYREDKE